MPLGVNSTRSHVLYRAAQVMHKYVSNIWKRGKVASFCNRLIQTQLNRCLHPGVYLVYSPAKELHSLSLICIHHHKLPTRIFASWLHEAQHGVDYQCLARARTA